MQIHLELQFCKLASQAAHRYAEPATESQKYHALQAKQLYERSTVKRKIVNETLKIDLSSGKVEIKHKQDHKFYKGSVYYSVECV